ncbi:MAG: hypothetical protein QOF89_3806 [Acidobacteriota bacterium]|jgi:hypothetical protein|nr:hypothetical protein [Acidobacteriota bacterium]
MSMYMENQCGRQNTSLELPDIVHMKLVGEVTLEECRQLNQAHLDYSKQVSYFFYWIDMTELEDLPAAVRREASATVKLLSVRGTVVYNAPLRARVLAKLLLTAANLFRSGPEKNPVVFAENADEAHAYFAKWRQQIVAEAA